MEHNDSRALWKVARGLHSAAEREKTGLFLIEGGREIGLARSHGIEIVQVLDSTNTSAKNLERITYGGRAVAVAKIKKAELQDFTPPANPLVVVLDRLEKPGNIGAVIRTAEAAGVTAVIVCRAPEVLTPGILTNPNTIRASLGAVFCLPVFETTAEDAAGWLDRHKIEPVIATPDAQTCYYDTKFPPAVAIIAGSEALGVSQFWLSKGTASVSIPMTGEVNSLNVSVSAAILIYEAIRRKK